MPIPLSHEKVDDIPEALREFYEEKDGVFELQVDRSGFVPASKIKEFRDHNVQLEGDLKPWRALGANVTPESAGKALALQKSLEGKELLEAGKADELVATATSEMKAAHEAAMSELGADRDTARVLLKELTIKEKLLSTGLGLGLLKKAKDDLLLRGLQVFDLDDKGAVVAMENGNVMYGADGEPLGITGWIEALSKTASHLFESSTGGDSPGSPSMSGDAAFNQWKAINPYAKGSKHFNLSKQAGLEKNQGTRALAQRLAKLENQDISERLSLLNVRNQGQPQPA